MTDETPTRVPRAQELVKQWRNQVQRMGDDRPHVAAAITACADELEAANGQLANDIVRSFMERLDAETKRSVPAALGDDFAVGDVVRHRETARLATVRSYDGPDSDMYEIQYHDHHTWATVHSCEIARRG